MKRLPSVTQFVHRSSVSPELAFLFTMSLASFTHQAITKDV